MTSVASPAVRVEPDSLADTVAAAVAAGGRFVGLTASALPAGATLLRAVTTEAEGLCIYASELPPGHDRYRSFTPAVPPAFWYERQIHDLFGLIPEGHPRLDPLVYPQRSDPAGDRPRPGRPEATGRIDPETSALPGHVEGEGVFTIPYGPVRSGVFETVEYLVETFGEDIPRVRVRPYLKHRGIGRRFHGMSLDDAVALAERVEGTMSVAHALAFAQAVEALARIEAPSAAQYQRLVHAELERIANHLDSMLRHTEGAGQAVAHSRVGWAKERVLRLQASLCGHRFGRGVIRPGGTTGPPLMAPSEARKAMEGIRSDLARDLRALMTTPSFLDRLRTTGPIPPAEAEEHGAVGPVGRASGTGPDTRLARPYGAYRSLRPRPVEDRDGGDALARQWVRVEEIAASFDLAARGLEQLDDAAGPWSLPVPQVDGTAVSSVESPQGELVYLLDSADNRLVNAQVRTASFHNFALFSSSFRGDIFTDFVFIEASFGVNLAGVAG
jgi:formate hydrogenlyase subunit 5